MIQDDFGNLVDLTTAATIHARLDDGDQRLSRVEAEQIALRRELEANTLATQAVKADTAELVELFQSFKGAIKVLNWLGKLAKPMAYIVGCGTACVGFWATLKGQK
ncbi:hypothetical protein GmRootA79_08810 [Acidovorax sp. A79]|uniref:hypothetical protein n=1 Tax=Acidovorax sp. A79 TaxID=3056107 RepID=UPI0034E8A047